MGISWISTLFISCLFIFALLACSQDTLSESKQVVEEIETHGKARNYQKVIDLTARLQPLQDVALKAGGWTPELKDLWARGYAVACKIVVAGERVRVPKAYQDGIVNSAHPCYEAVSLSRKSHLNAYHYAYLLTKRQCVDREKNDDRVENEALNMTLIEFADIMWKEEYRDHNFYLLRAAKYAYDKNTEAAAEDMRSARLGASEETLRDIATAFPCIDLPY